MLKMVGRFCRGWRVPWTLGGGLKQVHGMPRPRPHCACGTRGWRMIEKCVVARMRDQDGMERQHAWAPRCKQMVE
jgi:hypothetical protein